MSNYYEILQIFPSASASELDVACDTLYNKWRGLVNHQDPAVAAQANAALRTVETIRAILTDPDKRAVYDAGLGLSGNLSGLADPEALTRMATPTPPSVATAKSVSHTSKQEDANAWVCSKCGKAAVVGTIYCNKCGFQLGCACPKCKAITQDAYRFCSSCGVDMIEYLQNKQQHTMREIKSIMAEISRLCKEADHTRATNTLKIQESKIVNLGRQVLPYIEQMPRSDARELRRQLDKLMEEAERALTRSKGLF